MSFNNTPFYVGGYYKDRAQGYEVIDISPKGMKIKYDDGTVKVIGIESVATKARIYQNIIAEFKSKHLSDTDAYYWTLGFFAKNARFIAELPANSVTGFLNQYTELTGEKITANHTGITTLGDVDKWGKELRIYFPDTDKKIDLGVDIDIRKGQTPNIKSINNNSVWTKLIGMGFRLGYDHNVEEINKFIPKDKRTAFEDGQR